MLEIAVFDDEKIIVDYVGELIKENLEVNAKIYKYTKLEENPKIKIIYMTAYNQHSEAIFKTKPTYLLLKPIKKEQ